MDNCKVCNIKFKSQRSLISHLKKEHNYESLEDYMLDNDLIKKSLCLYCDNTTSFNQKENTYRLVCSNKSCIAKYANSVSKESFFKKHGVHNPGQLTSHKKKVAQTKLEKYGDSTYNNTEKNKQTCFERYGVNNGSKTEESKHKISKKYHEYDNDIRKERLKETILEKYGVEHVFQSKEILKKKEETFQKKWGESHPMKSDEYKTIRNKQMLDKFGVINMSQLSSIQDKIKISKFNNRKKRLTDKLGDIIISYPDKYSVEIKCPTCNKTSTLNIGFLEQRHKFENDLCLHCTPYKIASHIQDKLAKWFNTSLNLDIIQNYKIPNSNKEIDIFIPSKNIGIEVNGLYWHSEIYKEPNYHINKKLLGIENNINIINIWEDELRINEQIIKNRLTSILSSNIKVYGRKTIIKPIDTKTAKEFMNNYHIHGFVGGKIKLGLYYDNELLSVVILGNRHKLVKKNYELIRYATKNNYTIIGGFSKLIKYFIKNYNPDSITTYIDLDWSNMMNNVYEKSLFTFDKMTIPKYFWVINGKRENRAKFQKHILIKNGEDPNQTEVEIMHKKKYYRIWDCGNLKYVYNKKEASLF